ENDMSDSAITEELRGWLAEFEAALSRPDVAAATAMFDPDECFWRDMVAFTWNIATMDGAEAIEAMLREQLAQALPVSFSLEGDGVQSDDAIEGWFRFETAVARGTGHLRLRGGRCWTLLTALEELKGF